jgi:adenylate cyclase
MGGTALSRLGEAKRAKDWGAQALAISPGDATVLYNVACIYSVGGEADEAVSLLERAVAAGFGHWKWIENDSDFDPLRNHPGYKALLAKKET